MQLFFFASGYFYKGKNESEAGRYIVKKAKRLLIPCLIYNFAYALFTICISFAGFDIGEGMSLYTIFISSFVLGSDFKFNSPDWFIAQLFMVEVLNVLICKLFRRTIKYREQIICLIYLLLGMTAVAAGQRIELGSAGIILCRTLFGLSWYGLGRLYQIYKKYDGIRNAIYFPVILFVQLLLLIFNNGNVQGSVVRFSFGNLNVISVYLSALVAIAFWLRVCKLIAPCLTKNSFVSYIGSHTFSVVENQYLGFFAVNTVIYLLSRYAFVTIGFDENAYFTTHNYVWSLEYCNNIKIIYVVAGICVPMLLSFLGEWIKGKFNAGAV